MSKTLSIGPCARQHWCVPRAGTRKQMTGKRTRTALLPISLALGLVLALAGPSLGSVAAEAGETIWGGESPTDAGTANDRASVELGTAFKVDADGEITGIRYWRPSSWSSAGSRTGTLWTAGGGRVATAVFPSPSSAGWQTVSFASPVRVKAGESFVASYHAPRGRYAFTANYHGSSVSDHLAIPGVNAGRYMYSSSISFPNRTYQSSNYWVTPVFTPAVEPNAPVTPVPSPSASTSAPPTASPSASPSKVPDAESTAPGPTTTGVPVGTKLTTSGALRVTNANTVLSGLDITGTISIEAPGVVIKNSKIHGSGNGNGIQVRSGGVAIQDSEIYGFENGIGGDDWKASRVNIHSNTGDGIKLGSDTELADSWIHDLTPGSGAHADGIQVQSGIVNAVVRNNVIDLSTTKSPNAALFLAPDLGPSSAGPVSVEGNFFDGGNYTVQVVDGNNGEYFIKEIEFRDNTWGRTNNYGPVRTNVPVTWINNTYADTGAIITP
jgi:uncharacterized protein DUF4082